VDPGAGRAAPGDAPAHQRVLTNTPLLGSWSAPTANPIGAAAAVPGRLSPFSPTFIAIRRMLSARHACKNDEADAVSVGIAALSALRAIVGVSR
jgi:hypothetical protein